MTRVDADVITFTDLNTDLTTGNSVSGSGGGSTSSTGGAGVVAGIFTYSGFDFDGDSLADSFSFDVPVAGATDTTISNTGLGSSSAGPLGRTAGTVVINAVGSAEIVWSVEQGTGTRFELGEMLSFSVSNIQAINAEAAFNFDANFDGFTGGRLADRSNNGSPSGVFGLGTGLNVFRETAESMVCWREVLSQF